MKRFKRTLAMLLAFLMAASVFTPVSQVSASEISGGDVVIVTESDTRQKEEDAEDSPVPEVSEIPAVLTTEISESDVSDTDISAITASGTCGDNLTWTLDIEGTLTISGTGEMPNWEDETEVPWYSRKSSIKSVVIKNGVTSIGDMAFWSCGSIASITIPNSVTSIGESSFCECTSLTELEIPDGVTSIGNFAFDYCTSLENLDLGSGVQSIGYGAFAYCAALESVYIPASVTSIGSRAFLSCEKLSEINVDKNNTAYCSIDGVLFNKAATKLIKYPDVISGEYTVPDSVTTIDDAAFSECSAVTDVVISNGVTSIGEMAFSYCGILESVEIPDSVTSIGNFAFSDCIALTSIEIPDGVTSIGVCAFDSCQSLESIVIPDSVTSIGDSAFSNCISLKSAEIGDGMTSVVYTMFDSCSSLESVVIPTSVASIGYGAFDSCESLKNIYYEGSEADWNKISIEEANTYFENADVTFNYDPDAPAVVASGTCGDNLTWTLDIEGTLTISGTGEMPEYSLYPDEGGIAAPWYSNRSNIKNVVIGDGVTIIGGAAFAGCNSLTGVTIGDSVISIGSYAFYNCGSLESVTMGDSVGSIDNYAFYNCSSLEEITVPAGAEFIGYMAFGYCDSLKAINVEAGNEYYTSENGVLFNADKSWLHVYPAAKSDTEYTVPDGVGVIDSHAFHGNTYIESITLPDSIEMLYEYAICNCSSLKEIHISSISEWFEIDFQGEIKRVLHQGVKLYEGDTPVEGELVIPDGVTRINDGALEGYKYITGIIIPGSAKEIGNGVFVSCSDLTSVVIESGVTSIGSRMFYDCHSLESVTIPDSVTSIGYYAFYNCNSLASVTIGDCVTTIGGCAFEGCSSLESVVIPASVASIGYGAFDSCESLKNIYYEGSEEDWAAISIGSGNTALTNATITYNYGYIAKGTCGDNLAWKLNDDGTLIISGEGAMTDWESFADTPWYSNRYSVNYVVVGDGVTTIGKNAFTELGLDYVAIPDSVTAVGDGAFTYDGYLNATYYFGTRSEWNSIEIGDNNDSLTDREVTYFKSKITKISAVAESQLIENADGYYTSTYDSSLGKFVEYFVYDIDNIDPIITLTYSDGTTEECSRWDYGFKISAEQSYENQWGVGKHTATVSFMGLSCEFEVEVAENPVDSISVTATRQLIEGVDYDLERSEPTLTVNYKDGTTEIYDSYSVWNTGYGLSFSYDWDSLNVVGKYTATARFMGKSCEFEYEVVENPVESISVVASRNLIQDIDGYINEGEDPETGEYAFIYLIDECEPLLTVNYKDGTSKIFEYDEIGAKTGYSLVLEDDQSYDNQWGVGTHTATANFMDRTCEFEVTVESNHIESISAVATQKLIEEVDGYTDIDDENYEYFKYNLSWTMPRVTIYFDDGTSIVYNYLENNDLSFMEHYAFEDDQSENPWGVGKHTAKLTFMGHTCDYEVEVVENTYTGITISGDKYLGDKNLYITFTKADGTEEVHKALRFDSYDGGVEMLMGYLVTDRGVMFDAEFWYRNDYESVSYRSEDVILKIGGMTSNTLEYCEWWDVLDMCEWPLECIIDCFSGDTSEYNGKITADNIDDIITMAVYNADMFYADDGEKLFSDENGTYYLADTDAINTAVSEMFCYEGTVDYTKSSLYDSESGKIKVYTAEGYGGGYSVRTLIYNNGLWEYRGDDVEIHLDDEHRIVYYSSTEDSGSILDVELSGTCGDDLTWELDENGTLTISGSGDMDDYIGIAPANAPWYKLQTRITAVVLDGDITSIGDNAFNGCSKITDVYFSGTKSAWNNMSKGEGNEYLLSAELHIEISYELTADPESSQKENLPVTFTAEGGDEGYTYEFYRQADGEWFNIQNRSAANTCTWTPTEQGEYIIYCDIWDAEGVIVKTLRRSYTVTDTYTFTLDKENVQNVGVKLTLTAEGGSSYKFYYEYNGAWCSITTNTTGVCEWSPKYAGEYMLYVDIRDADGNVITCRTQAFTLNDPFAIYCDAESAEMSFGKEINFMATGGTQYKFYYEKNGAWVRIQDFSETATCAWTPTAAGVYNVYVDIKDDSGAVVSCKRITFNITNPYSFTASVSSPQNIGASVTLKATGGKTYKFYCEKDGVWSRLQAFSMANTCTWKPTASGRYMLYVDIADANNNVLTYMVMEYIIGAVDDSEYSFTTSVESPQPMNTSVTLTAEGGTSYKFYYEVGGKWATIQNFSTANTCTWTPDMIDTYKLYVDIKDSSGKVVKTLSKSFTATDPYSFTVSKTSPQDIGTTVTLTANGGASYKFYYQYQGAWVKIQDSTTGTCDWRPNKAGTYLLYVDIKNASGTVVTCRTVEITFNDPFSFTTTASSLTHPTGTAISLAADGGESYKFYYEKDGAWVRIQNFSTDNTCTWTPTQPGKYNLFCDIKDASGSVAVCKRITFNITERCTISADKTTAELGEKITLTATGGAQYKFYYELNGIWVRIQSYSTSDTCTWTPSAAGDYMVYVDIQDENGTVIACKGVQVTVE